MRALEEDVFSIFAVNGQQEGIKIGIAVALIQELVDNLPDVLHIEFDRFITSYTYNQLFKVLESLRGGNPLIINLEGDVYLFKRDADAIVSQYGKNMAEAVYSSASPLTKEKVIKQLIAEVIKYGKSMLNDYEHRIIEDSLYHNPLLAIYKLGWFIKHKIRDNQIAKYSTGNQDDLQYDGYNYSQEQIQKRIDLLRLNDCDRIKEIINGVLMGILEMLPQGSGIWDTINDQTEKLSGIQDNYIAIIAVLNAAIDAFNKELEFSKVNRGIFQ